MLMTDGPELNRIRQELEPVSDRLLLVGGAVRDILLDRTPADLDFLVVGTQIDRIHQGLERLGRHLHMHRVQPAGFPDTIRLVARHLTLDFTIVESRQLHEDLMRRDFTINAMALEPGTDELLDPTRGKQDLQKGLLRATGPGVFEADPVRILRLYRFMAELDFSPDPETERSAVAAVPKIQEPAGERIQDELFRILANDDAWDAVEAMAEPVLTNLFPSLAETRNVPQNDYHHLDVFPHTLEVVKHAFHVPGLIAMIGCPDLELNREDRIVLRLAALFHDVGKAPTAAPGKDGNPTFHRHQHVSEDQFRSDIEPLRVSNRIEDRTARLIRHHMRFLNFMLNGYTPRSLRRLIRIMDTDSILLGLLAMADKLAARGPLATGSIDRIAGIVREFVELIATEGDTLIHLPKLVSGEEVMDMMDLKPGAQVGRILDSIRERQIADPAFSRNEALELISAWKEDPPS